ncbi:uncharacterized protein MELLADRAFT_103946 [Melampsora larici-populina 98AG31]|uniref:Uncharacterized protein n=1 Tax=Melampsora larici-populina (strain 98AG31 / pathotype 3-4-7) TaxID=747676 RepID=F4RD32_MELLP|nr:uncharacterized protein MELLADRAFT_103946 [Melampsora larici-populina 98AG31]EGG09883.1 hypothetical protein MELLADRAFT_103946 [Melampsora larici-populina 98AG31]
MGCTEKVVSAQTSYLSMRRGKRSLELTGRASVSAESVSQADATWRSGSAPDINQHVRLDVPYSSVGFSWRHSRTADSRFCNLYWESVQSVTPSVKHGQRPRFKGKMVPSQSQSMQSDEASCVNVGEGQGSVGKIPKGFVITRLKVNIQGQLEKWEYPIVA